MARPTRSHATICALPQHDQRMYQDARDPRPFQLRLILFGSPQVSRADGSAITFRSRKHFPMLACLAVVQRHSASRDTLLALL